MREEASDGGFVKGIPMIYEGSENPLSLLKEEPVQFSALCARGLEFAWYGNWD